MGDPEAPEPFPDQETRQNAPIKGTEAEEEAEGGESGGGGWGGWANGWIDAGEKSTV